MTDVFLRVLSLGWQAGILVAAILIVRLLLRKLPHKMPHSMHCVLWGLVALRLLIPVSINSPLSLQPMDDPVTIVMEQAERAGDTENLSPTHSGGDNTAAQTEPMKNAAPYPTGFHLTARNLAMIWVCGMAGMVLYFAVSYGNIRRKVSTAVPAEKGVYYSDAIDSPFVLGLLRPKIYLPFSVKDEDVTQVIAHERMHIKRHDHYIKPLAYLLLSVYWFHPVLWMAYLLLCRDIEGACDERVLQNMTQTERTAYSRALVNCAVEHRHVIACPVAFGEMGVKERVKNILDYKKPTLWVILLAAATCAVVAVCFLTQPQQKISEALDTAIHNKIILRECGTTTGVEPANAQLGSRKYTVEAHRVLRTEEQDGVTTAYLYVCRVQYDDYGKKLNETYFPLVMTFTADGQQSYTLEEYTGGTYTEEWFNENFPKDLAKKGLKAARYEEALAKECESRYVALFGDTGYGALYNLRTPYVGNASAVSGIWSKLDTGSYGKCHFTMTTDQEPYGITISYDDLSLEKTEPETLRSWSLTMYASCCKLLSLVGNARWVAWQSGDGVPFGCVTMDDIGLAKEDTEAFNALIYELDHLPLGCIEGAYGVMEKLTGDENAAMPEFAMPLEADACTVSFTVAPFDGEKNVYYFNLDGADSQWMPDYLGIMRKVSGQNGPIEGESDWTRMMILNASGRMSGYTFWLSDDGVTYALTCCDAQGNLVYSYRCAEIAVCE